MLLAPLQAIAERWKLDGYLIAIQILKALASHAQEERGQARRALERAKQHDKPVIASLIDDCGSSSFSSG